MKKNMSKFKAELKEFIESNSGIHVTNLLIAGNYKNLLKEVFEELAI